jgi:hypothetical protein
MQLLNSRWLIIKHPLFLSDFNQNLNFFDRLMKIPPVLNFMKIRPVGAEFHEGGQT